MVPHHFLIGANDAPLLGFVMHGVLGAGHNLRSFAKRLVGARPELCLALIDLRYHGKSVGAPPPHRLESCVDDLLDLASHLGRHPEVVIGHSLGGKIALRYAHRHEKAHGALSRADLAALRQIWTLDSDPGAQEPTGNHEVEHVMASLRGAPGPFTSRPEAVAAIVAQGRTAGLANWLATSLERTPGGYVWLYDLDAIEELLRDYFTQDEWSWLETLDPEGRVKYDLLVAENSDRWSGSMKDRAAHLAESPRIRVHTLRDSGHWVHVDNPDGLLEIVAHHLIGP